MLFFKNLPLSPQLKHVVHSVRSIQNVHGNRKLLPIRNWKNTHSTNVETSDYVLRTAIESGSLSGIPEKFNFSRDVIDFWANNESSLRKNIPALWTIGDESSKKFSFEELSQLSKRISGIFHSHDMNKGDRIFICLPKCAEYWLVVLAALRSGVEFSAVTTQATALDLRYRIKQFKPKMIISNKIEDVDSATKDCGTLIHKISTVHEGGGWMKLQSLVKSCGDFDGNDTTLNDPALVFFTSGTTGKPKMVEHSQSYLLGHVLTAKYFYNFNEDDVFWCMADTGWAKAAYGMFPPWLFGSCVFVETSSRFRAEEVLATLQIYPITKLCAPPTVYRQLIKEKKELFNFPTLKDCVSAGEPLNPEAYFGWKKLTGIDIREGYGQSETTILACTPFGSSVKPGSMGKPMKGISMKILDNEGHPVERGQPGHLVISVTPEKPFGLFQQYRGDSKRTEEAFKFGYYFTGDKAYEDEDGYIWFVSRSDDVITSSGYRIGPFEVESVILEHPAVVESAVVGVPDPERFEVVKAFIVLTDEYKNHDKSKLTTELQDFVKERTAPYKYPRKIEFVDTLPKTMSGKIQRNLLREKS